MYQAAWSRKGPNVTKAQALLPTEEKCAPWLKTHCTWVIAMQPALGLGVRVEAA